MTSTPRLSTPSSTGRSASSLLPRPGMRWGPATSSAHRCPQAQPSGWSEAAPSAGRWGNGPTTPSWRWSSPRPQPPDLRQEHVQDQIAAGWARWARTAPDVGHQARAVLSMAQRAARHCDSGSVTAAQVRAAARTQHQQAGRSGGNGSLMRTAPVALAYLHDEGALIDAASALSALTHHDPEAAEACVLWCLAIRHAVLTGRPDVRVGLPRLDGPRQMVWAQRLDEAETTHPADFEHNGWVVQALQAAWSAITHTPIPAEDPAQGTFPAQHLQLSLEAAVRGGRDTDTVAAIAGGLLGATHGVSAVPAVWRRILHGWAPEGLGGDITAVSMAITTGGARHPISSAVTGGPAGARSVSRPQKGL